MHVPHLTNARLAGAFERLHKLFPAVLSLLPSSCLMAACAATEGPLFSAVDAGAFGDAAVSAPPPGDGGSSDAASVIRKDMRLQYQLAGSLDQSAAADLFVVDLFETTKAAVEQLKGRGRVVVAFIAAGSYEPWRSDVGSLPASAIGDPLVNYPNEAWLDVRASSVRELMAGRLTLAAQKNFDGVLLVSLDGYLTKTGHDLTSDDQLDYNLWLASQAAERGLAAGISSDWAHAERLADAYDFAIHLNCLANRRCAELEPYRERGRPVFDLETRRDATAICAEAEDLDLSVTVKNDGFDAWLETCR